MNTRGEHRAAEPGTRSRTPRTAALLLLLAVAATGATWGEVHYAGAAHNHAGGGGGAASQDGVRQDLGSGGTVDDVAALRLNDVLPATVSESATPTSPDGYLATRYQAGTSDDCDETFTITAPEAASSGCTGYLTADYVQEDHSVYTSVTVFFYADAAAAARAAKALDTPAAAGAVTFQQPRSGLPDAVLPASAQAAPSAQNTQPGTATAHATPGSTPGGPAAPAVQQRIEAVGSAVDVVESVSAGDQPAGTGLSTPTWYLAYTVGTKLAWQ